MQTKDIFSNLKSKFNDSILELVETPNTDSYINVEPSAIKDICMYLRDTPELKFDYMGNLTGMDYKDSLGVVYHLYSTMHNHNTVLKVKLNREKPEMPTVERVWKTANWHEREAYDMFGICFEGHPDLERILCPEDWVGYPLRKDYVAPTEWHGIDATPNMK
ncbi:MAG: NADH-quinone oxidoreductase subunit C [Ignavibacteria bacterium]|jgi:NADH-quinone oxidoreductase subunit C|nr:NADH-quinone oxidoreductase subunit C [Ignavibacteria bacterium]